LSSLNENKEVAVSQTRALAHRSNELITNNKEITMISAQEKKAMKEKMVKESYDQWREMSQAHWSHWRAWGSWFSWGSPVGLGLFFVLTALAVGGFIWLINL
jgi:hypothetical protein